MNLRSLLKKVLVNSCVYFTVVTAVYAVMVMIVNFDDEQVLLDAGRVMLFFLASVLFAVANGVLKLSKLHGAVKLLAHFILTVFAYWSCLLLPLSLDSRSTLTGIAGFTVLYFAVAAVIAVFKSRYKKKFGKVDEYKSQFSK